MNINSGCSGQESTMNKRKVRGARRRGLRSSISWTLKKRQMRSSSGE
jgi:hypothetical protein